MLPQQAHLSRAAFVKLHLPPHNISFSYLNRRLYRSTTRLSEIGTADLATVKYYFTDREQDSVSHFLFLLKKEETYHCWTSSIPFHVELVLGPPRSLTYTLSSFADIAAKKKHHKCFNSDSPLLCLFQFASLWACEFCARHCAFFSETLISFLLVAIEYIYIYYGEDLIAYFFWILQHFNSSSTALFLRVFYRYQPIELYIYRQTKGIFLILVAHNQTCIDLSAHLNLSTPKLTPRHCNSTLPLSNSSCLSDSVSDVAVSIIFFTTRTYMYYI